MIEFPDLLRDLKEVAKRGKLNCGHCNSTHFGKPWLGHSALETTSCSLTAISGKQKGMREKADATFAGITVQSRQGHQATIRWVALVFLSSLPAKAGASAALRKIW